MKKENLGMELDHTENYLDTSLDDKKVKEVVKAFNSDEIIKRMESLREKRKLVNEDRLVKGVCTQLFPNYKDDTDTYYTSFDDHIKLIDKEIEDQEASLLRGLERLKLLQEKKENIIEVAEKVTSDNWELPVKLEGLSEHFVSLLKEHFLTYHPKLVGNYYGEHRYTGHCKIPRLEYIRNEEGEVVKVRCMDCYLKALKETPDEQVTNFAGNKRTGELDLHCHLGGEL